MSDASKIIVGVIAGALLASILLKPEFWFNPKQEESDDLMDALQSELDKAVEMEDYLRAAKIRDIINSKKAKTTSNENRQNRTVGK